MIQNELKMIQNDLKKIRRLFENDPKMFWKMAVDHSIQLLGFGRRSKYVIMDTR